MFKDKTNYKILIVEDEIITSEFIKRVLISLGFTNIYISSNAKKALDIVNNEIINCAFMDINIQGSVDGISCAKMINEKYFIPIVYTTAYQDTITLIEANETNIASYLIKPFFEKDIEVNLYIALNKPIPKIKIKYQKRKELGNGYRYDKDTKKLYLNNQFQELTQKEQEVLFMLYSNINNPLTLNVFKDMVWKTENISDNTIRDAIFRLRKKAPLLEIKSISGVGYMLKSNDNS